MKKKIDWKVLIYCLIAVCAVAWIGSLFTSNTVNSAWYQTVKPSITPPNPVFPIVWTILFFLIGLSLYIGLTSSKDKKHKKQVILVFAINFLLNILWSVIYFGMKNPLAAFIEILFLAGSIILMISATRKINKTSAYLLIPYLIWVLFAAILNYLSIK